MGIVVFYLYLDFTTYLFSQVINITPYTITQPLVWMFGILLVLPHLRRLIEINIAGMKFKLEKEKRKKERNEYIIKLNPAIPKEIVKDNKLQFILENKQYFEGFGFYYKKLEEIIKKKLSKNKINFKERIGLGYLFNLASTNGLIDSMSQKRIALFLEARNRYVHANGELELSENQLSNILIMISYVINELNGES